MNLGSGFRVRFPLCVLSLLVLQFGAAWAQQERQVSVDGLIYDLKHPDPDRRKRAALLLGQNKVRNAVPALVEAAGDDDDNVRLEVVRALVEINDTRALSSFIRLTRDSEEAIQRKAIEGIIQVYVTEEGGFVDGVKKVVQFVNPLSDDYNPLMVEPYIPVSEEAVVALSDLLFAGDDDLRRDGAEALGILRAKSALTAIEEALARETSNSIKVELIRALYKIGDPTAGNSLIPLIRDPDKKVHDEAIFAAGGLRIKEAAPQLNELYSSGVEERKRIFGFVPVSGTDDLQRKVLQALAKIGDPSSEDIFVDALESQSTHYRRYAAEGLGRIGDTNYLGLLARKEVREESGRVKRAMHFALYLLGRQEHLLALIDDVDRSEQAYYYLFELNPSQVEALYPHVQGEKDSIKVRLLDVLGSRGGESAIPVVEEMVNHENVDVMGAATNALRRLRARFPNS